MDMITLIEQAHKGDKDARDKLVTENLGLIWSIVRRFGNRGHEMDDLFQIGCIGLIKAIDNFDTSFGVKFSTYAVPMITGEIKRFLRDDGMIKVSRSLKEIAGRAKTAREFLSSKYNREVTVEEIAQELEITPEELVMALESNADVESLYKTIYQGDGNDIYLIDKLEENDNQNEEILNKIVLDELLCALNEKEQKIVKLRYFMDKTQTEIAKEIGISQVQVSRLEKKILKQMRQKLETPDG